MPPFTSFQIGVTASRLLNWIDPDGEARLENILFGELWIASGQSNMEMTNIFMRGKSSLYGRMSGKKLRIFAQDWLGGLACDGMFPFEPQPDLPGAWIGADDTAKLDNVSACASAAILELYDRLNRDGAEVPVGFLNVSVGATAIDRLVGADGPARPLDNFVVVDAQQFDQPVCDKLGLRVVGYVTRRDEHAVYGVIGCQLHHIPVVDD